MATSDGLNPDSQLSSDPRVLFLDQVLKEQARGFDRRSADNFRWVKTLRLGTIGAGAVATILLGMTVEKGQWNWPELTRNAALVLSAFATALAAVEAYFNPRDLWVRYTMTSGRLKSLRAELQYRQAANELTGGRIDKIFEDMQGVLAETNSDWAKARNVSRDTKAPLAAEPNTPPAASPKDSTRSRPEDLPRLIT